MAKGYTHKFCQRCHGPSRWAVCDTCFSITVPCSQCGRAMPQVKRDNTPRPQCAVCTRSAAIRANYQPRAVCKLCKARYDPRGTNHSICPACFAEQNTCRHCNLPMPKYNTRGAFRTFCSETCKLRHNCHNPEMYARATLAHYGSGPRKTPEYRRIRISRGYRAWRRAVLARDGSVCQHCHQFTDVPEVHHVKSFADFPALRLDVSNGITLCYTCHTALDPLRRRMAKPDATTPTINAAKLCPQCGKRKAVAADVCRACYTARYAVKVCPDCSKPIANKSHHCQSCAARFWHAAKRVKMNAHTPGR